MSAIGKPTPQTPQVPQLGLTKHRFAVAVSPRRTGTPNGSVTPNQGCAEAPGWSYQHFVCSAHSFSPRPHINGSSGCLPKAWQSSPARYRQVPTAPQSTRLSHIARRRRSVSALQSPPRRALRKFSSFICGPDSFLKFLGGNIHGYQTQTLCS
jgi:hypothetical protein